MYNRSKKNPLTEYAKAKTKHKIKKMAFALIKPYLVPVIILVIVFVLVGSLISAVYTQLTGGQTLVSMATELTEEDKEIKNHTIEETEKANKLDLWVGGKKIDNFVDAYGRDLRLALTWGQVYSVVSYDEISNNKDITKTKITKVARDLHPTFHYMTAVKKIERYNEEKHRWELDSKTTEYLLTKADTLFGAYTFTYNKVTETEGNTRITYYQPDETKLQGEKNERLKNYIKTELEAEDIDMEFQTLLVIEAGQGYDEEREQLEWLIDTGITSNSFISVASIPAELMPVIKEMSEKYNIPVWFLCGLIWVESTFDVEAVNSDSGALGLMQVMPSNWKRLTVGLGYDPEADKPNPKAQIEVGIKVLLEHAKQAGVDKVDWDTRKLWQTQISPALALYGGYGKSEDPVTAGEIYLNKIFKFANEFKISLEQKIWPVPGFTRITSGFKQRLHPIDKVVKQHEGIDIAAPVGTPAVAVTNGKVVYVGWLGAYGKAVVVRDMVHDYLYAHLSDYAVSVDDEINIGDIIAYTGNTGKSTGPHLHFGISIGNFRKGKWINPLDIVKTSN